MQPRLGQLIPRPLLLPLRYADALGLEKAA
jgi:hypothetical protein